MVGHPNMYAHYTPVRMLYPCGHWWTRHVRGGRKVAEAARMSFAEDAECPRCRAGLEPIPEQSDPNGTN